MTALFLFLSNPASADYITPGDLTLGTGISWDQDEVKPEGSGVTGAPGFGTSSFYSNVTGSAAGGGVDYTAMRIYADAFATPGITVGDITSLTYWTYNTDDSLIDWQVKMYTAPEAGDTSWFNHRLNFNRPDGNKNVWVQSDIDVLIVSDVYDKTAEAYLPGPHDRWTYASEQLRWIDIIAGYASASPPVRSYLDGKDRSLEQYAPYPF